MKRLLALSSAVLAGLLLSTSAQAVPIAAGSEISIDGSDTFTATSITFNSPAGLGGTSGSFTSLGVAPPVPICATCVTMTTTVFTSAFSGQLYSVTNNGATSTLDISPPSTFTFTGGALPSLNVTGAGTLTLTGFDPTPGIYDITTQGPTTAQVTFSATSVGSAVPEPTSMAVLGSSLFALAWMIRRRQRG